MEGIDLEPGVSYELPIERHTVPFDPSSGWLRVGGAPLDGAEIVEFVSDCLAEFSKAALIAVWMHPTVLKTHPGNQGDIGV